MNEIINNPDAINHIINSIRDNFDNVIKKYDSNYHNNVLSYFLNYNCNILVEILYSIFGKRVQIYYSSYLCHVIIKLGSFFYDIEGVLKLKDVHLYEEIDYETFLYYEDLGIIGNLNETSKRVMLELTNYALKATKEVLKNHNIVLSNILN